LTSTGTSAVALTFDDGPGGNTNEVLDLLAQHHIKATFCVIGRQVPGYPDAIRRIVAEGHTLCNHTWSHDLNLRDKPADQIRADLQRTNDAIHAIVPDAPIKYFREPGGNWGTNTVSIAASLGMASLHWSVDPQDWRVPPPQAIINNVCGHTAPGGIVLMHDGGGERHNTVVALRTILPNLASRFTLIALPTS
jgi:peptidoglycan/xylan/chitin deacetylase (PgdA/CDA1 family)